MSRSEQIEGHCWLCNEFGQLTQEHIPPRRAFNEFPLLLQAISDRTHTTGELIWETKSGHQHGFSVRSLCSRCNNVAGTFFAPSYIEFIKKLAERLSNIQLQHRLTLQNVRKPQLILREVMQQFVSANGPTFAGSNPWVRPFLQPKQDVEIPDGVFIYLFAMNKHFARTTGISGHVHAGRSEVRIVSEFTFWPLGTVLSYGELADDRLAPIHHWSKIPYRSKETVDITLCVNATASALPIDFRTQEEISREKQEEATESPSEADLCDLQTQVLRRAGKASSDSFIYTASPSQVDRMRRRKVLS